MVMFKVMKSCSRFLSFTETCSCHVLGLDMFLPLKQQLMSGVCFFGFFGIHLSHQKQLSEVWMMMMRMIPFQQVYSLCLMKRSRTMMTRPEVALFHLPVDLERNHWSSSRRSNICCGNCNKKQRKMKNEANEALVRDACQKEVLLKRCRFPSPRG